MRLFLTITVMAFSAVYSDLAADSAQANSAFHIDLDTGGLKEITELIAELSGDESINLHVWPSDHDLMTQGEAFGYAGVGYPNFFLPQWKQWHAQLLITHWNQTYRVVSVYYQQSKLVDTDKGNAWIPVQRCDMNLLSGHGMSSFPESPQAIGRNIDLAPPDVVDWRWEMLADICGEGASVTVQ